MDLNPDKGLEPAKDLPPSVRRRSRVPGDMLLGMPSVAAAMLIVANDFGLRPRWHGFWSGKLSDIGICFLFPVLLVALCEWGTFVTHWLAGRRWQPSGTPTHLMGCIGASSYYAAMELVPGFGRLHAAWLSAIFPFAHFRPGTPDPTDLLALVMVPVAFFYLQRGLRTTKRRTAAAPLD